MIVIRCYCR